VLTVIQVAVAPQDVDAAGMLAEVGDEERPVLAQGDAVRSQRLAAGRAPEVHGPGAVRTAVRDAAAPVGREQLAPSRREHALGTLQARAGEAHAVEVEHGRRRGRCGDGMPEWRAAMWMR
jgi:hypothetical protein